MRLGFILHDRKSKFAIHGDIVFYVVICYIILTRIRNQIIHNRPFVHFRFDYKINIYCEVIPLRTVKGIRSYIGNENDSKYINIFLRYPYCYWSLGKDQNRIYILLVRNLRWQYINHRSAYKMHWGIISWRHHLKGLTALSISKQITATPGKGRHNVENFLL